MTLCSEATLVKRLRDRLKVVTIFCRSWSCETCAPKRAAQVSADIKRGKPHKFLTLTVNPGVYSSPEERAERLAEAFRAWIRKVRSLHKGQEVEYYAVFERTEQGEPHLHVAGRWPYVRQAEISAFFKAKIAAPVVDIRRVKTQRGLARYLSKYLSKDCQKFGNLKRYFRSRGYAGPRPELKEDPVWRQVKWERSDLSLDQWSQLVTVWGWWRATFDSGAGWEAYDPAETPFNPRRSWEINPMRPPDRPATRPEPERELF